MPNEVRTLAPTEVFSKLKQAGLALYHPSDLELSQGKPAHWLSSVYGDPEINSQAMNDFGGGIDDPTFFGIVLERDPRVERKRSVQ